MFVKPGTNANQTFFSEVHGFSLGTNSSGQLTMTLPLGSCAGASSGGPVAGTAITANNRHHIAITYGGVSTNVIGTEIFLDGASVASATNLSAPAVGCQMLGMVIGKAVGSSYMAGIVDEFRMSKYRVYTAPFTGSVPNLPFVGNTNTLMLLHLDSGGSGMASYPTDGSAVFSLINNPIFVTSPFP